MQSSPLIEDQALISTVECAYGFKINTMRFLPLGADFNTAVYRLETQHKTSFFLKLRRKVFHESSVLVPKYLADCGFPWVIAPIAKGHKQLWTKLADFKAILYPYVEGVNGVAKPLSEPQWHAFGSATKALHTTEFPSHIAKSIPKETFSAQTAKALKQTLKHLEKMKSTDTVALALGEFLQTQEKILLKLIHHTTLLAQTLRLASLDVVLCHADIHPWNLLIDQNDRLYIIDWDTLIYAPKERDLMFIGAGIADTGLSESEEKALFYQGYGDTHINHNALAYYRVERILQDIAEYCEHILDIEQNAADRVESLEHIKMNFLDNRTIARAFKALQGNN